MLTIKINQLTNFLKAHENAPKQDDPKWKESRAIVGGSNFDKIISERKPRKTRKSGNTNVDYRGPCKSVLESLFKTFNFKTPAMNWGHVFEPMSASLISYLLHTEIHETGSIPGLTDENGVVRQSYSPDGIFIAENKKVIELLNDEMNVGKFLDNIVDKIREIGTYAIILLEMKNPYSRDIPENIPTEYKKQPLVGMATIPIIDYSLFVNTSFKKCSIKDFDFNNNYDTIYHKADQTGIPHFIGFIGIYEISDLTEVNNNHYNEIKNDIKNEIINELFAKTLHLIKLEFGDINSVFDESMSNAYYYIILCQKIWQDNDIYIDLIHKIKIIKRVLKNYNITDLSFDMIGVSLLRLLSVFNNVSKIDEMMLVNKIIDFGEYDITKFNRLLDKIVTDRGLKTGYKCYYPNMIGSGDAKKWLSVQIAEFVNYCKTNNFKPIGIMPCKLMKIAIIPVMPKPNFIQKHYDNIKKVTDFVIMVRKMLENVADEETRASIIDYQINKYMDPDYEPVDELDTDDYDTGKFNFEKINDELLDL